MLKKVVSFIGISMTSIIMLYASPVAPLQAERVALAWMQLQLAEQKIIPEEQLAVKDWYIHRSDETDYFYVFNFNPAGFVIVAAHQASVPILGYSLYNYAPYDQVPASATSYYDILKKQLKEIADKQLSDKANRELWDRIINDQWQFPAKASAVSALIKSKWNQGYPWNAACPHDPAGSGGHVLVGCVAVSLAQVLHYWKHPIQGAGFHSYYHKDYGLIFASFSHATYDWNHMPDNQASEASQTLLFHAGVTVNMNYGPGVSVASTSRPVTSLVDFFKYDDGIRQLSRSSYNSEAWKEILKDQLDLALPMLYRGNPQEGVGHAFVCDGYDQNDYFHFNWGWGGAHDGYFHIDQLHPGNSNYSLNQMATIDIRPANIFLTAEPGDQRVELNWNTPLFSGMPESYEVFRDNVFLAATSDTCFVDQDVDNRIHYSYYVAPVYEEGSVKASNQVTVVPTTGFLAGNGIPDDPYLVSTAEHLDNIRFYPGLFFLQTDDIVLDDEIWTKGQGWHPIGTDREGFPINYDGGGHTISKLFINRTDGSATGLFGNVNNARIKNLFLIDVNIQGGNDAGALAGYLSAADLQNVSSTGSVYGGNNVGGLIGRIGGQSSLRNTWSACDVEGLMMVGGLTGRLERGAMLNNAFAMGEVIGESQVGGLAGSLFQASVNNAYAASGVTGDEQSGGLIGAATSSTVTNSYWDTEAGGQEVSAGGTGLSGNDMRFPYGSNAYAGWNFTSIWMADSLSEINNGYPVLRMKETYSLRFHVVDAGGRVIPDAVVELNGEEHDAGQYIFDEILEGIYPYSVSKVGHNAVTGSIEISGSDETTEVTLELMQYQIDVVVSPESGGDVIGAGTYTHGSSVHLTATAAQGFAFLRWTETGEEVHGSNNYQFTANTDRQLTAHFQDVSSVWERLASEPLFKVYPNPLADHLIVEFKNDCGTTRLMLIDMNGRVLADMHFEQKGDIRYVYNLEGSIPGIYLVRLQNASGGASRRVIVTGNK